MTSPSEYQNESDDGSIMVVSVQKLLVFFPQKTQGVWCKTEDEVSLNMHSIKQKTDFMEDKWMFWIGAELN